MTSNRYFQDIIERTATRSVEATVSMLSITDIGLRQHLVERLGRDAGVNNGFLADPVFEAMFPWEKSANTMAELSGKLLLPSLIEGMDKAGDQRFGKEWSPFKHQVTAWKSLLEKQKSLVVTSGTGSGKTECFMVPILNDLASEFEQVGTPLVGVRALFVYPLNALINSQRDRLRAWTDSYGDGVRFCLYNGNTAESKHEDQGTIANEILTRKVMRDKPAPILLTNSTMLEYMLVRQIDEPIVQKSQGKLRWIVLDEAHSYIGSQAAELSLLLRRVLHTFGVEVENVRFIATSATMGGADAAHDLQVYLAKLAGVDTDKVVVVGGRRAVPSLPVLPPPHMTQEDIALLDCEQPLSMGRYEALSAHPISKSIRQALTNFDIPQSLNELRAKVFEASTTDAEILSWLDLCSMTSAPGPNEKEPEFESIPFLPIRGHIHHQVLSGLWCCVDKSCAAKQNSSLTDTWPFGMVHMERRNHCTCGAPVYELLFCEECNTPYLLAVQSGGNLIQMITESVDEFSLETETIEEGTVDPVLQTVIERTLIAPFHKTEMTNPHSIEKDRSFSPVGIDTIDIELVDPNAGRCVQCAYSGYSGTFYRRSMLGTPFYISNSVPVLLDACDEHENASNSPSRGRRLITFTDSRQGTARISTKIQQDSERDAIRGLIYGETANNVATLSDVELAAKKAKLDGYEERIEKYKNDPEIVQDIEEFASKIRIELANIGVAKPLDWNEAVSHFQSATDISRWIFDYYRQINPAIFEEGTGIRTLVEMLLLREFSRRPKRQNSMETLGLVAIQYPALKEVKTIPAHWSEHGLDLNDWRDFLKVTLDFYIRENSIIDIPREWVDWMGARIYPKTVVGPNSEEQTSNQIVKWPQVVRGRNGRLVRLLSEACQLAVDIPGDKDLINGFLKAAWQALIKSYQIIDLKTGVPETRQILKVETGSVRYRLDRRELAFSVSSDNWICPVTRRLLDSTFRGITPYLPYNHEGKKVICEKEAMPIYQVGEVDFPSDKERRESIRNWVNSDQQVNILRQENLWTDVSDRIVEGSGFFRAAEHSAQQPASTLKRYEAQFKMGKINILNCSTTMEMGVDIGGISIVAMNNVPPHPANYLQRAGRAGRRGETQALAFTICKDNPHERNVFVNPTWAFKTEIAAPYVTLNSERIVQRHINALVLSYFLKHVHVVEKQSITSLNCAWFFTAEVASESPADRMIRWVKSFNPEQVPTSLEAGIDKVIAGSILAYLSTAQLVTRVVDALNQAQRQWLPGYQKLVEELDLLKGVSEKDPYHRKVTYDMKCMGEQYLLGELASKAFLPGYGFPTGIATFDHYSISDYKKGKYVNSGRIDNQMRMRERPGRGMPTAIREYAPGADVVMDGLVYRSAGILMNRFNPDDDHSERQLILKEWRCHRCGYIGNESGATFDNQCSDCGTELRQENVKEYVEPIGFTVDFYSSPTIDISLQKYVATQEPWVTAHAPLTPLFAPKLGEFRSNTQGHVFHHSSGEYGNGYAVCLRCGKADSMTEGDDWPKDVKPNTRHRRLQGKAGKEDSSWCAGPEEAYSMKRNLHLGATDQTDVFELFLKNPVENSYIQHNPTDPLTWTLAVVLRQALADIHGVDATEMGYTVNPSNLAGIKEPAAGIVLFDSAGGGAGFASSAPKHIKQMFTSALRYLSCSEDCDSACQACLVGYDTRFHLHLLNRHVAINYVEKILPFLGVVPEAQLFGASTEYCVESVSAELLAAAAKSAESLRLFVSADFAEWDIASSSLKESCLTWRNNFELVELVIPAASLAGMSDVHKEDLWALSNFGIKIVTLASPTAIKIGGGCLLAQVLVGDVTTSFATSNVDADLPSLHWWNSSGGYVVKTEEFSELLTQPLPIDALKVQQDPGDREVEIFKHCDGKLVDFGNSFWESIVSNAEVASTSIGGSANLVGVSYSDLYICSSWNLILIAELIDALKKRLDDRWSAPALELHTGEKGFTTSNVSLYAEWNDAATRQGVITEYFEQMGESVDVEILPKSDLPHGRIMELRWDDNSVTSIRFDHGVGCWSIDGKATTHWIDVKAPKEQQVSSLFGMIEGLRIRFSKRFPTQIFVKHRSE
jgi:DEAD/DEAH box helicase domain-containing protein